MERVTDVAVERFDSNLLIPPEADERIGTNVNGPSDVRVPNWIDDPRGRYYCYFGHHEGTYVRLAYADDPCGPWTVHEPGVLPIERTRFADHLASPDVHVNHDERRIRLYFHGCTAGEQETDVAVSADGLDFDALNRSLGETYFRVWEYDERYDELANDGHLWRGVDPLAPFERRQELRRTVTSACSGSTTICYECS